jgi:DNA-binding Lrp family transcriptional regulator
LLDSKKIHDFPVLDELDRSILALLAQNGRMSNAELAEQVGLAQSTCLGRVRSLVQSGVITSFTAEIAPEALGLQLQYWQSFQLVEICGLFYFLLEAV